ncbi:uncharacterized protein KIAA0513 homolog [Carlito syrichta]|uniref:Uncharacterized protein KIAA0513 homolog n=1 Tax=Carlito syrichta TaxID=1868482 RepID=A0A1U7T7W3_CARSF|nr:uncharacterized protein KIAA0513 homolog [Carlito syrichta]
MEAAEVPLGSLIDFGPEPPAASPLETPPPTLPDGDGSLGDGASESETTESADSENDMGESPSHPSWDQDRRSSSNESFSSSQSSESAQDEEALALRDFMRSYVDKIFSGGEDLDQEEKAKFGEYCSRENGKGREWFARYVSAQRCNSKCVSEATFYRLVQSFAVVLFECHQMDDFGPAKNLMTMCFTYYHIGKPQAPPVEPRERPAGSLDAYLRSANSWLAEKKDVAERLLRTSPWQSAVLASTVIKILRTLNVRSPISVREEENKAKEKPQRTVTVHSPEDERKGEKVYLYTHLKQQPIWHTLRFWNAAFFDAVHCERRKRSPTTRGDAGEEEEKSTFTHNMLAFGLNQKLCQDFLKKQAVIGHLDEEQYKLLSDHIEQMATE